MQTILYRGWVIQVTFLSEGVAPTSVLRNGVRVLSPNGDSYQAKSVRGAKTLISRRIGKT